MNSRDSRQIGDICLEGDEPFHETAFSEVWKGRLPDGRAVAVKCALPGKEACLSREAYIVRQIMHPHILPQVVRGGRGTGLPLHLVSELVQAGDLGALIRARRRFEVLEVRRVGMQLARALMYLHEDVGILHRDLKPGNVLITEDGDALLLDFTIWKSVDAEGSLPRSDGEISGTVAYMAPEQIRNEPQDVRTDLYQLGLVLAEMMTGARVFCAEATDQAALLTSVAEGVPPSVKFACNSINDSLGQVIAACIEPEMVHRPKTAARVFEMLQGVSMPFYR